MSSDADLRKGLQRLLSWEDAHVGFEKAVADVPTELRGQQPPGLPYSLWQLLEHLRITQWDILDFCRNPKYEEISWPKDYWPSAAEPTSAEAWDDSVASFRADRRALEQLAADPGLNLFATIPHGSGQTYFRELVLVADHTAYHVGQIVLVRRMLGIWSSP